MLSNKKKISGKKKNGKSSGIKVEAYADKATSSARHFVATLGDAIINLPRIQETTQEAADQKAFKMLDSILDAFTSAQSDAIKYAVADICNSLGVEKAPYPLEN